MSIKTLAGILILLTATVQLHAQKKKACIQYAGIIQGGPVAGSSSITYTLQTIQGIRINNWMTGIGIGYDDYGVPGFPLVLHGQRNFTKQKHQPFIYAQTGIQFPLKTSEWDVKGWNGESAYELQTGFVAEVGAGYQLKLNKRLSMVFSTGFSYKHNKVKEMLYPIWIDNPAYNYQMLDYYYRRIAVKVGFEF